MDGGYNETYQADIGGYTYGENAKVASLPHIILCAIWFHLLCFTRGYAHVRLQSNKFRFFPALLPSGL